MNWVRKPLVHLLALLLLITLLLSALFTSVDLNLSKPAKVEGWLQQSNLYGHFVSEVISQSKQSVGSSGQSNSISLSDSAVQQAAQTAFSPSLIQQDVNTFLDSNYAWLQGKTTTPNFTIDLTSAKASFATQVGQYVTNYFTGLPVCSTAQLAQLQNIDPLTAPCRPTSISAAQEGATAQQQIATTGNFLSNPVLTANSINPNAQHQSQPYYQKLSKLPKLYQLATKLPFIVGAVALLSALGIIFIYPGRRRGLRKVGITLLLAGVILVAVKFAADMVFKKVEDKIFNSNGIGQLQQSLTNFASRVESALTKTNLYFGIVFIVLGLVIIVGLIITRNRTPKPPKIAKALESLGDEAQATADAKPDNPRPASRPVMDIAPVSQSPKPSAPLPEKPTSQSPKAKRPRLIQ